MIHFVLFSPLNLAKEAFLAQFKDVPRLTREEIKDVPPPWYKPAYTILVEHAAMKIISQKEAAKILSVSQAAISVRVIKCRENQEEWVFRGEGKRECYLDDEGRVKLYQKLLTDRKARNCNTPRGSNIENSDVY